MVSDSAAEPEGRVVQAGLLLDSYGRLLTERQRLFMRLHFEQDLSFSEIAREYSISRQAVHDSVKHAIEALQGFERALGLVGSTYGDSGDVDGGQAPIHPDILDGLERLRSYVHDEREGLDASWIEAELDDLIQMLRSGAGE